MPVIEGDDVRTGVSVVILPVDFEKENLAAGCFVLNGNGEMTGMHYSR